MKTRKGEKEGGWLRVQTKVSLQPAPRLHIMRLLAPRAPCALRYLSLILSLRVFLVTAFYPAALVLSSRRWFSSFCRCYTPRMLHLSGMSCCQVYQERPTAFSSPSLYVFPSVAQLAVYFRRQHIFCAKLSCVFFSTRFRTVRMAHCTYSGVSWNAFSIKLTRSGSMIKKKKNENYFYTVTTSITTVITTVMIFILRRLCNFTIKTL